MCLTQVGRIVDVGDGDSAVVTDAAGTNRRVSLAALTLAGEPVATGDWVLVHTGFAVERLGDAEAASLVAALADLQEGIEP
jgi:hydrogenase expression/formation protein HypC